MQASWSPAACPEHCLAPAALGRPSAFSSHPASPAGSKASRSHGLRFSPLSSTAFLQNFSGPPLLPAPIAADSPPPPGLQAVCPERTTTIRPFDSPERPHKGPKDMNPALSVIKHQILAAAVPASGHKLPGSAKSPAVLALKGGCLLQHHLRRSALRTPHRKGSGCWGTRTSLDSVSLRSSRLPKTLQRRPLRRQDPRLPRDLEAVAPSTAAPGPGRGPRLFDFRCFSSTAWLWVCALGRKLGVS